MKRRFLPVWFQQRCAARRQACSPRRSSGSPEPGRAGRLLGLSLGLLGAGLVRAEPREVYVFGDSAVDMGNYFALPQIERGAQAPYYTAPDGFTRLSDGPMWPERLYPGLAVAADPHRTGSRVNFAYGDAKTDYGCQTYGDALPIGVQSQLDGFAAEVRAGTLAVTARSYAFIEAGPNDYFAWLDEGGEPPATLHARVAGNLATAAERLAALGVRTIFVHDLPDFGDAPAFYHLEGLTVEQQAQLRQQLNALAADGRAALRSALLASRARLGREVNLVTLPINALFTALRQNPGAFGFGSMSERIYDESTDTLLVSSRADQQRYAFVDSLHLTTAAQAWEARYYGEVIAAVEGRPQQQIARLGDAALSAHEAWSRELLRTMPGDGKEAPAAGWRPFVETSAEGRDGDAGRDEPAWRADTGSLLAGAETTPRPGWTMGGAIGISGQRGDAGEKSLRFDLAAVGGWLFGSYRAGEFALRGLVGAQHLDYRLKRDPHIPTMLARSEPGGMSGVAMVEAGRMIRRGRFAAEVFGDVQVSTFRLNGFSETGAPGLNLRFARTRRDSALTSLGIRSAMPQVAIGVVRLEPRVWVRGDYGLGDLSTSVEAELIDNTANPVAGRATSGGPWRISSGAGVTATLGVHHRIDLDLEDTRGSGQLSVNAVRVRYRYTF